MPSYLYRPLLSTKGYDGIIFGSMRTKVSGLIMNEFFVFKSYCQATCPRITIDPLKVI